MRKNLLKTIGAITLAVSIPASVLAGPDSRTPRSNPEPQRIYDLGTRNFIDNPNYRRPAPSSKRGALPRLQVGEVRRVYDPMTQQFEDDPGIRAPR